MTAIACYILPLPSNWHHLVEDAGHQGIVVVGGQHGGQPLQALPQHGQQVLHPRVPRLLGCILLLPQLVAGQPIQDRPAESNLGDCLEMEKHLCMPMQDPGT